MLKADPHLLEVDASGHIQTNELEDELSDIDKEIARAKAEMEKGFFPRFGKKSKKVAPHDIKSTPPRGRGQVAVAPEPTPSTVAPAAAPDPAAKSLRNVLASAAARQPAAPLPPMLKPMPAFEGAPGLPALPPIRAAGPSGKPLLANLQGNSPERTYELPQGIVQAPSAKWKPPAPAKQHRPPPVPPKLAPMAAKPPVAASPAGETSAAGVGLTQTKPLPDVASSPPPMAKSRPTKPPPPPSKKKA